ncbi:nuclear pore complex protein NUP50A-like [Andrographis paniculata]|uniref:nuclear pore complex protein NUP50A-like n=1 Tax=Andrographis paniculata TaxID=175694 RepID=UPI0021E73958|nr:nuclear pore complex protein NUP50A-like [Andrographis paniculata]XP_051119108.1 nuclear pore complex protein NUP50A-like [Andrographis paniculata]
MGDSDNSLQPSKKRAAGVQLSRDNPGLDDSDEESPEQEAGTFKKASEEVLATRRIVKVRRQQASSTPSSASDPPPTSNPFSSICLVPTDASGVTSKEPEESSADAESTQSKVDESNPESEAGKGKESEQVEDSKNPENVAEEEATDNAGKSETKKDAETDEAGKGNGEATTEKKPEPASFGSFRHLSSSQNAFSGLAQTGLSNTSFTFGSLPQDGPLVGSSTPASRSMQEVHVETGEENEKAVFTSDSVLYEFTDGSWKERGKGELKVNVAAAGAGKARLIMRTRGNYRLILNASLFPEMKLTNMDKKGVTFACVNTAGEGKDGLSTIALKFKDASIVEDFRAAVGEHKGKAAAVTLKTPENSPQRTDV